MQAGSCRSHAPHRKRQISSTEKETGIWSRCSQRRLFYASPCVRSQNGNRATEPVSIQRLESPSLSNGKAPPSQIEYDDRPLMQVDGGSPFFKPWYEVIEHGGDPSKHGGNQVMGKNTERRLKLQPELDALEQKVAKHDGQSSTFHPATVTLSTEHVEDSSKGADAEDSDGPTEQEIMEQIRYLRTVRELEDKLEKARHNLHVSMKKGRKARNDTYWREEAYQDQERVDTMDMAGVEMASPTRPTVKLKKEDFLGLVDLYFYSHRTRFLSEAPDSSPTPLQLDEYSFKVSQDFSPPTNTEPGLVRDEEGTPVSPLYHVEAEIKARKLSEIKALQNFVDLLMDDYSSLGDLFHAYKGLPQPGVSYLSGGIIRLFLQRMSTPWKTTEKAMLRYLSLLDDMQGAGLPITPWEWSSAIHLAGRSFSDVSSSELAAAFRVWHRMEKDAGIKARDVTFNILFDIAVKAKKFVLAEHILKEMHDRGFRLNRLGRVGLIYYYGKKGDGDGVRKAYRDFVDAGEIVDTLVLNCVMASLINAQEPAAAEQIYERMKGMQERLQRGTNAEGEEGLFIRYPPPGPDNIGAEMASNALGRVLLNASRLKTVLPDHHAELQNVMPLTPNATTYRILMSHHAKTSGNIDRLTVLLNDMTRQFKVPVTHTTFQVLFRGFAVHGGSDRSDAKWTAQRLQIAWTACLVCIKAGKTKEFANVPKESRHELPSVKDAEKLAAEAEQRAEEEAAKRPKPRRPTAWDTFIHQFMSPYPETKPFDLYSTSLDSEDPSTEDEVGAGEDYRLPPVGLTPDPKSRDNEAETSAVKLTKPLVLWAIRAFTRCTTSRSVLEDVWWQVTRVWRPSDALEKAVAIRELRRALRYCDTHGRK
jgi:pentatricopeptide repeat protein